MKQLHILYFASLGEALGLEQETLNEIALPCSIADLKTLLSERGESWNRLINDSKIRCAVNQTLAGENTTLSAGDEIAFFPPVTGG